MTDTTLPGLLDTGAHASRPAAGDVGSGGLFSCTDHDLIYQSDGSSWTTWATVGGSGGIGLIATTVYNPGTQANYSTTSGTLAALDTTNLRLTFTAPASGDVLIKLSGVCRVTGTTTGLVWGLMDGAATVSGSELLVVISGDTTNVQMRPNYSFLVTGLTPDQEYDFDWAHLRSTGSGDAQTFVGGDAASASAGAAIMEAWAA